MTKQMKLFDLHPKKDISEHIRFGIQMYMFEMYSQLSIFILLFVMHNRI